MATHTKPGLPAPATKSEVPEVFRELQQWGKLAKDANIIPAGTNIPQAMVIVQAGREMGLQPLQSLRSMNFIKGRLTMSVQLQLAMATKGGVTKPEGWLKEKPGECTVTLERDGASITCTYTMDDAKKAGLVKEDGAYDKYAKQMLRWRAIGDALRLIAPDLVLGLLSPEEAESIEPIDVTPVEPEVVKDGTDDAEKEVDRNSEGRIIEHVETIVVEEPPTSLAPEQDENGNIVIQKHAEGEQVEEIEHLRRALGMKVAALKIIMAEYGAKRRQDLTYNQAEELIGRLKDNLAEVIAEEERESVV